MLLKPPCAPAPRRPRLRRLAGLLPLGRAQGRRAPHQPSGPGQAESGRVPEEWRVGTGAQLQAAACRIPAGPARPGRDGVRAAGQGTGLRPPPSTIFPVPFIAPPRKMALRGSGLQEAVAKPPLGVHQRSQVVKSPESEIRFHLPETVQPWARSVTSLCLSLLLYKTG